MGRLYIADMAVRGLVVDPEAVNEDKERCRDDCAKSLQHRWRR